MKTQAKQRPLPEAYSGYTGKFVTTVLTSTAIIWTMASSSPAVEKGLIAEAQITLSASDIATVGETPEKQKTDPELEEWLRVSASSFDFWDNDEDAFYDTL